MNRSHWILAMLAVGLLMPVGCSKRVPSPDLAFEAQQRVVLTFRTGEQVEGRIDLGRRVELRDAEAIWTGRIKELGEDRIVVTDLVRIRDVEGVQLQAKRLKDARLHVSESVPDKTFLRAEITGVDILKTDAGRTARAASFWSYGAVVLALLVGERS